MTGLEKMVSQILEEADASAAVMISDAEKKAAEILGEAGEKADKIRQQREEQSRAKVKSYEERTASAADMKKRTAVLAAKQELIGKVIADACDRVKNLDEGKYFEILKSMAEKYLLPREGEICFSKKDLERMPANFRDGSGNLCPFLNRCKYADKTCEACLPKYYESSEEHKILCHRREEEK